jgi:hypothetical protein
VHVYLSVLHIDEYNVCRSFKPHKGFVASYEYQAMDFLTYHNLNLEASLFIILYHVPEVHILSTVNHDLHHSCHAMYCSF